jgi:hypothetical protein
MTERTPYALLYECLRRLRQDMSVGGLVANPEVEDQIRNLGLFEEGMRLVAHRETVDSVRFSDVEKENEFYALAQNDRLLRVGRVEEQ